MGKLKKNVSIVYEHFKENEEWGEKENHSNTDSFSPPFRTSAASVVEMEKSC